MMAAGKNYRSDFDEQERFHNYYERLVVEEILRSDRDTRTDSSLLSDIACVALNHLPPRYIRYDVDMSFFLSPQEYMELEDKIHTAVNNAIAHVHRNRNRDREQLTMQQQPLVP